MSKKSLLAIAGALLIIGSSSAALPAANKIFIKEAMQGNLAEIQVGKLAQQKGESEEVRKFGQMLVTDHSANNDKAQSLAKSEGISPPTEPSREGKQTYKKLSKLSGDAFDKQFAAAMVKDHKKEVAKFEAQSKGNDAAASFAKETLPTLKHHLEMAVTLK